MLEVENDGIIVEIMRGFFKCNMSTYLYQERIFRLQSVHIPLMVALSSHISSPQSYTLSKVLIHVNLIFLQCSTVTGIFQSTAGFNEICKIHHNLVTLGTFIIIISIQTVAIIYVSTVYLLMLEYTMEMN